MSLASGLAPVSANMVAFYQLLCLLALEFGYSGVGDMVLVVDQLQQLAVSEGQLQPRMRSVLHSCVAGVLYFLSFISDNDSLQSHVADVISTRRSTSPYLLPDTVFSKDMIDGGWENVSSELLFNLRERGLVEMSPELMRNPSEFWVLPLPCVCLFTLGFSDLGFPLCLMQHFSSYLSSQVS